MERVRETGGDGPRKELFVKVVDFDIKKDGKINEQLTVTRG